MATILLVEDQIIFRENLAEALEDHGYAVVRANDGAEALRCVDSYLIDLFVLDVALPGMNGLELLKNLRSRPALRRIPAMFLTAFPRQDALEEAGRMGVGDFLVKSDISLKDLLERIERGLLSSVESTGGISAQPSSRSEPIPSRRHLRPALRRWRPVPARPQIRDLFAMAADEPSNRALLSYLLIDPESSKWLRRILSKGAADAPSIDMLLAETDPRSSLRLLLARAVVDGAMRSMEPSADLRRLWKRALTTALLAEELSPVTGFATPLEAFVAGLCVEVPWVFAIQALETEYGEVKAEAWEEGIPIRSHLAAAFGTDPATLALETVKSLEVTDNVWKAVVDLHGKRGGSRIWEPGIGGKVLDIVSELAHLVDVSWHPCTTVRSIQLEESKWLRRSDEIAAVVEAVKLRSTEIVESGAFPEAMASTETRGVLVSDLGRRFRLLRSPDVLLPDPLEAVMRTIGEVEIADGPEGLQGRDDAVRVAVAEPGTDMWDRILETTRRVVIFHCAPLPRHAKMGPHAEVEFPVTLTGLERALRPRT